MAGLLEDLLSGRSSDIYGAGLLTPEQRGGLGNIGLLALAGKLGQLAGPSFSPVPDFGAALGQAAGAYGASQEGAGTAALNAILTGQKGRKLQQELDYYEKLGPILAKMAGDWPGAGGSAGGGAGGEGSGSTGGTAAPLGAGGGGADPSEADIVARESGGKPYVGYGGVDLSNKPLNQFGFPIWEGRMGPAGISHAAGLYQFQPGTWATYAGPLGVKDFSPESQRKVYLAARAAEGARPWAASAGGGGGRAAAAPTAAAPDGVRVPYNYGAPSGGPLAVPTPNPLSDAEPMVGIPRPVMDWSKPNPAAVGPAPPGAPGPGRRYAPRPETDGIGRGAAVPQDPNRITVPPPVGGTVLPDNLQPGDMVNGVVFKGGDPKDPRSWAVAPRGAINPSGGGGPLAAPPGAGGDPIMSVTSADQAGGGEAPAAGPPRAALPVMGPAGIELPPMQGPLAAPAPAAAAPAAPGPGLLSPPGALPAAPALPRVNPAYDAYARNLAVAAGLAKGAGLPDALGPLLEAFKGSPAFQQQLEIAKRTAGLPFTQAEDLFKKQVEIAGVGPIEAAKLPYALAQEYFKADQQIRTAGPVAAAQNFERIKADNAAKGIITTMGADGQIKLSIDPDAVKAVTGATVTAPKQAEADIARETTRLQQEQAARYDPMPGGVPVMGADGKTTMMPMSRYEYDLRKRLEAERRGAGATPSGPQPGDIVAAEDPVEVARRTKAAELSTKEQFDERDAAEDARLALQSNERARPLVEKAILGAGSDLRIEVGRGLKLLGLSSGDDVVATQTFLINQLDQASRLAKRFGTGAGITERDVENAKALVGGSSKLEKQTILNTLDIVDQVNRYALQRQHEGYDRITDNGRLSVDRSLYKVPIPVYSPEQMKNLPPGTPIIMPDGQKDVVPARK